MSSQTCEWMWIVYRDLGNSHSLEYSKKLEKASVCRKVSFLSLFTLEHGRGSQALMNKQFIGNLDTYFSQVMIRFPSSSSSK